MKFDSLGNVCTKVTDYVANGSFKSLKENVTYEGLCPYNWCKF